MTIVKDTDKIEPKDCEDEEPKPSTSSRSQKGKKGRKNSVQEQTKLVAMTATLLDAETPDDLSTKGLKTLEKEIRDRREQNERTNEATACWLRVGFPRP